MHNKPHSEETKLKLSIAHTGKKRSESHKKAISLAVKRRHKSGDLKEKCVFKNGYSFWKGKERSKEDIAKMKIGRKNIPNGNQHWNWRNGITPIRESVRKIFEYRQWVSDVFTKDDYTCQKCFVRGGDLEADHHPKMFSQILDENKINTLKEARECLELWNINNGRTLCKSCHKKTYTGVPKKPWRSSK